MSAHATHLQIPVFVPGAEAAPGLVDVGDDGLVHHADYSLWAKWGQEHQQQWVQMQHFQKDRPQVYQMLQGHPSSPSVADILIATLTPWRKHDINLTVLRQPLLSQP